MPFGRRHVTWLFLTCLTPKKIHHDAPKIWFHHGLKWSSNAPVFSICNHSFWRTDDFEPRVNPTHLQWCCRVSNLGAMRLWETLTKVNINVTINQSINQSINESMIIYGKMKGTKHHKTQVSIANSSKFHGKLHGHSPGAPGTSKDGVTIGEFQRSKIRWLFGKGLANQNP